MTRKIAGAVMIGWIVILSAASLNAQRVTGRVSVIVGQNAPALEKFAASELCGYLNKLFDLQTQPTITLDANSSAVFLIGSPATNGQIKSFPRVSDQGIVIQAASGATPILIVGGGSPRATLWAVYELAERWGCLLYTSIPFRHQNKRCISCHARVILVGSFPIK